MRWRHSRACLIEPSVSAARRGGYSATTDQDVSVRRQGSRNSPSLRHSKSTGILRERNVELHCVSMDRVFARSVRIRDREFGVGLGMLRLTSKCHLNQEARYRKCRRTGTC